MTEPYRPLVAVAAYHLDGTRVARWPEGGYGVQVVEGASTRYVAVETGMFAGGKVEVRGIDEGVTVAVPT